MQANIANAQRAFNRNVQSGHGAGGLVRRGPVALLATSSLIKILPVGVPRTIVEPVNKQAVIAFIQQFKQGNYPNTSKLGGFIAMLRDMTETVENPLLDNISQLLFSKEDFAELLTLVDNRLDGGGGGAAVLSNCIGNAMAAADVRFHMLGIALRDENYPAYFRASVGMLLVNLLVRFLLDPDRSAPGPIAEWLMDLGARTQTDGLMARLQYGATAKHCLEWLSLFLQADAVHVSHLVRL